MSRFQSLALAAAVLAPAMMSVAPPAAADQGIERSVMRPFVSRPFVSRPFTSRHHAGRRAVMRAQPLTRVAAVPANVACGGPWCGREFVLMIGIGF